MSDFLKIKQIEGLSAELSAKALDSAVVKKANHLSDVDATNARTNLSIYSKSEVDAMVAGAKNAYNVNDIAGRNALTGLKVTDRVFVNDDGDGKWALYIVTAITTGAGSTSTYKKLADEDLFTNALTASAVKAAYESNPDTYSFDGTQKGKLDYITVTAAVNLDSVKTTADNALGLAGSAQSTANGAASAASFAQGQADFALVAAGNAQGTANDALLAANNAQLTANGKEDAFTTTIENFTNLTGTANNPVSITVQQTPRQGFSINVFFNGVRVRTVANTQGSKTVTYTVPYATEASDDITVAYSY
jgi:hypothetical protein